MAISKTLAVEELCRSIINLDRNVRSSVVINPKGEVLHMVAQQKFTQPSFERWNDPHFMECAFEISMGGRFDELYGPIRYHYSDKDGFIMFSFPLQKNVIIVTCTKKVSPISFATEVSHLIYKVIDEILE